MGFRRGMLQVLDCRRRFTSGEMDYLYDNGINPIRFAPGRGILIWGQDLALLSSNVKVINLFNCWNCPKTYNTTTQSEKTNVNVIKNYKINGESAANLLSL